MSSTNQQINTQDTDRQIIYSSTISFLSICGFFAGGYIIYYLYKRNVSDQEKYIAILVTIFFITLCGFAINRSLAHRGLVFWRLRSIRIALVVGVLEGLVGVAYAYALYFLSAFNSPVRDALLQPPVIFAVATCVLALYVYLFCVNIKQTRLFFLSVTLTVIEVVISLIVFIVLVWWILSKNINTQRDAQLN